MPVVRTILKINEAAKSMTFAGDMPVGARVRFMKADFEKLINSAGEAANKASVFLLPSHHWYSSSVVLEENWF